MTICIWQTAARLHRILPHVPIRCITHASRLGTNKQTVVIQKHEASSSEELERWLRKKLPADVTTNETRPRILDGLARSLLSQQRYADATKVYKRLVDEGYHASPYVTLSVGLITSALSPSQPQEEVLSTVLPVISDPSMDETALRELVDIFNSHGFEPTFLDSMVAHYVASRGADYFPSYKLRSQLVHIHREANTLRNANRWLGIDADVDPIKEDSHPFAAFLAGSEDVEGTLSRMKSYGISPDTSIFNALIGIQIRQKAYDKAFELYRLMQEADVTPDTTTYASLFTALHKLNHLKANAPRSRLHPLPPNPLDIRGLYQEMLSYHCTATSNKTTRPSSVISSSALSIALRAFLSKRDLTGAFTALRGFHICGLKPSYSTYTMAIRQLSLHASPPFPESVDLGDGLEARLGERKTYRLYFDNSEIPEEFPLAILPLQRLLRRKILAVFEMDGTDDPVQALKTSLRTAKSEMVPRILQKEKINSEKGGRRRRNV